MSCYHVYPHCGTHLDPGEVCDCRETKKTALDATNIQDGGVEHVERTDSTSYSRPAQPKVAEIPARFG